MFNPICCAALVLLLSFSASADDTTQTQNDERPIASQYIVSIDAGGPGSRALLAGNYSAAIDTASKYTKSKDALSAYMTLCAAQISQQALNEARDACDAAVKLAKNSISTARSPFGLKNRQALAKAYSNRAVLHRMSGNLHAADADFAQALSQRRHQETVRHNIDVEMRVAQQTD